MLPTVEMLTHAAELVAPPDTQAWIDKHHNKPAAYERVGLVLAEARAVVDRTAEIDAAIERLRAEGYDESVPWTKLIELRGRGRYGARPRGAFPYANYDVEVDSKIEDADLTIARGRELGIDLKPKPPEPEPEPTPEPPKVERDYTPLLIPITHNKAIVTLNDTIQFRGSQIRYVVAATWMGKPSNRFGGTDTEPVPWVIAVPLAGGDKKPSARLMEMSPGMYASSAERMRFDAPTWYGKQAATRYAEYVRILESFGNNGALAAPFVAVEDKPEEPEPPPPPSDVDDPALADVVIRHSAADGTTIEWDYAEDIRLRKGKPDSIYAIARHGGFVLFRGTDKKWRRSNSIGVMETRAPIHYMVGALHKLGLKVYLDLGVSTDVAAAIRRKREYLEGRADRMDARGERKAGEASSRLARATQLAEDAITKQEIAGYFPTPPELARVVVEHADVNDDQVILEPSAGHGALALAIRAAASDAEIDVIEHAPQLYSLLTGQGFALVSTDLFDPAFEPGTMYDRVVMNPPFEHGASIDHVRRAWEYLAPEGRLVAVLPGNILGRQDHKHQDFRAFVEAKTYQTIDVDRQKFGRSGDISTLILILDKPEDAPAIPASAATTERIAEARMDADAAVDRAVKAAADGSQRTRERYSELRRAEGERYRHGEELSKAERAELKALGMSLYAEAIRGRAERIKARSAYVSAVDVSKGGRTAAAKRRGGASQTHDAFMTAMQDRLRKLKGKVGADTLKRGRFSSTQVSYGLRWEGGGKSTDRFVDVMRPGARNAPDHIPAAGAGYQIVRNNYSPWDTRTAWATIDTLDPDALFALIVAELNADPGVAAIKAMR